MASSNNPTITTDAITLRPINLLIGWFESFLSITIMALNKLKIIKISKARTIIFIAIVIPILVVEQR
jgi:hypothetical protein